MQLIHDPGAHLHQPMTVPEKLSQIPLEPACISGSLHAHSHADSSLLQVSIGFLCLSISGKAAATIFGRIKAFGSDGRAPSPEQMLQLPAPKLRKAGLSAAKVAR